MSPTRRVRTPTLIQMEAVECGAAALGIVLGYFGKFVPLEELRVQCGVSRDGSNAFNILEAAKHYGLVSEGFRKPAELLQEIPLPAILFWEYEHFLVLEGFGKDKVYLNDPATGPRTVSFEEFSESYAGIALEFKKGEGFQKSGAPSSFLHLLKDRLKRFPRPLSFLMLTGLCLLLPGFAVPAFLMMFLDTYFSNHHLPWEWTFLFAILFTTLFSALLSWTQLYFLNRLNARLSIQFSTDFLWHLLRLPMSFYTQRHSGEIAYRMTLNDAVAEKLSGPFISTLISVLLVFLYGAVMLSYDLVIALLSWSAAIINLLCMHKVFQSRAVSYACLQQDIGKSIATSLGGLQYIETLKAKGSESDFFSRWAGIYTRYLNSRQEIGKKDVLLASVPAFFQFLTLALLLGIGSIRIIDGSLSVGKLMALQLLLTNFLQPVNRFVGQTALLQNMKIDIDRLDDVTKNARDPLYIKRLAVKRNEINRLNGRLEFRNVSFRYAPLAPLILQNVSFTIEPGQRIAFVGPSGSGKTTIAKLAAGLYSPTEGEILYDGRPIDAISIEQFRDSIATVDQEIFLFEGTIRENLTFWNSKVPDEALLAATHDAAIHEEILMRPNGYDALLIEEGRNLSGGQRQRLEIARALLYNPTLVILDEATSALDSETEETISKRLRERGCSALMVAHRLSTIQDCHEIIVLDRGSIVQRGTHEALKSVTGLYQELVKGELSHDSIS